MANYKISIGRCEVVSLLDTRMQFPWGIIFPDIPLAEIEAYRELYPDCYGDIGFATDAGCFAVRSGGKTTLVDTGIGPGPVQMLGGLRGRLLDDMKAKGITPESIDTVVHTHLHLDHVGWNLTDGKPTFPNARYWAPKGDYDFFSENLPSNPQMQQVIPLLELGRLETYDGEVTITDDLTTMPTPGHTPGHHSVLLKSSGETLLITGDVAHHPAQADRTDWSPAFDTDPVVSAATRKKVMERLEAEGHPAAFCHFSAKASGASSARETGGCSRRSSEG